MSLAHLLLIQLPSNAYLRQQVGGLGPWVSDIHMGGLDGVLGSGLWLGPALVDERTWGVNLQIDLSTPIFFLFPATAFHMTFKKRQINLAYLFSLS